MGYYLGFSGCIAIKPPLNESEIEFLQKFSETNHEYVDDKTQIPTKDGGTTTYTAPREVPGPFCKWTVSDDGKKIVWNGEGHFGDYEEWMEFFIEYFLQPGCKAASELPFLQANHICNGAIDVEGEEGAKFQLVVENNRIRTR